MGKFTVSLDDKMTSWVREHAGDDVEAYFTGLVEQDQRRKTAENELLAMLDEADASGVCEDRIEDIWAEAEAEYLAKHG